jgi:hypothetical protein
VLLICGGSKNQESGQAKTLLKTGKILLIIGIMIGVLLLGLVIGVGTYMWRLLMQ